MLDRPHAVGRIQGRGQERLALDQVVAVVGRHDVDRFSERGDRVGSTFADRPQPGTPHRGPGSKRTRSRLVTVQDRLQQVDGGEVGEARHGEVGQFLGGAHDVQGASDA